MSENSSNTLGVMLAFIVGGIIGAGLALLYAPSSGEETRRRLREEMEQAGDKLRQGYEAAVDTVEEGAGKVKEIVEERKGEFVAAYQAGKEVYQKEKGRHTKETA
ncbi:MAG: YtxH domain-containing protein [Deltaproteobacteria bacterium]|nr:YtxH domain-containing protein [Deltaproteobacteria bacterium]MBI3756029.1 YtxH domain-containing protein [Deltaproteobacteria bacterium]